MLKPSFNFTFDFLFVLYSTEYFESWLYVPVSNFCILTSFGKLSVKVKLSNLTLDKFLIDYENYENDNRSYEHIQMQDYHHSSMGVYGGVAYTSGFIPKQQLRVMGHKKRIKFKRS